MDHSAALKVGRFALIDQKAVLFGSPVLEALGGEIAARKARRVLFLTTASLAGKVATISGSLAGLEAIAIEDRIPAHTLMPKVFEVAARMRTFAPDLVIAIGGGSVIDAAKIAALVIHEDIRTREELIGRSMQKGGAPVRPGVLPPMRYIAVPTTLSGAEFGTIGGSVDPQTKIKFGFGAPYFCAETVIFDPDLVTATPDWLWLSSGIRAVDHAVEGLLSPDANPFVDGCSLHALDLLGAGLRAAKRDPNDRGARQQGQFGVWLAAQGIGRVRYGASHGIGHQLGAIGNVPHGYTSCVLLPSVLTWNAAVTAAAQERVRAAVDPAAPTAAAAIGKLIQDLGLPTRLADVNVGENLFERIAELAMANPFVRANPRPITSAADVVEILRLAA